MENHCGVEDYLVQKANILINASYSITTTEQQLLIAGISRFNPKDGMEGCREPVELTITEMQDLFYTPTDRQNAYRDIEAATNRLFERELLFGDPDTGKYSRNRWVKRVDFDKDTKTVTLWFNETLAPYFFELTKNYTSYRVKYAAQLTSIYAIRIYELIVSWYCQNRTFWEISLDDLRMMLGVTAKYKQFGQLREKVIEIALNQINESTDFELDVSYRKRGRSYTHIQFRFNRKNEAVAEDEARKAKKAINKEAKAKRLQAEAHTAAEVAKAERGISNKEFMDAIPDNTKFVDPKGIEYVKSGVFLLADGHPPIPLKYAVDAIKTGKVKPA